MPRQATAEGKHGKPPTSLHVGSIVQTNQLRVKLCNLPSDDQTPGGPASGRGNFKSPAGTPSRTAAGQGTEPQHRRGLPAPGRPCRSERCGQRRHKPPYTQHPPWPTSPGRGAPRPPQAGDQIPPTKERSVSAPGSPTTPAALGHRACSPAGATKPGDRGTPEAGARAALRARQRSAEGEEPRRCPAAPAPRGAVPGPSRAPPHPGTPARRSATTTSHAPLLQKLNEKKISTEELYKPRPAY